jgi:heme/copper-type cytochrome/quinol oxidase subunit 2
MTPMRPIIADAIFWCALACCVVAQIAILRSALARHERPADAPAALPHVRRGVEMVWALLPAFALAGVLFLTWRAVRARADVPPDAPPRATGALPT